MRYVFLVMVIFGLVEIEEKFLVPNGVEILWDCLISGFLIVDVGINVQQKLGS